MPWLVAWCGDEMKHIIDRSEVLGTVVVSEGRAEVCAEAVAEYEESKGRLVVKLTAFLRKTDLIHPEQKWKAAWLPEDQTVTECAAPEECHDMATDIFEHWVRKVRAAAPTLHPA